MVEPEDPLRQTLLAAIDEGLLTLGESGREAIYFHLQNLCALKKAEIPDKPETFAEGIRGIFGVGAEVIERSIVKSLCRRLGLEYKEQKGHGFLTCLRDILNMSK